MDLHRGIVTEHFGRIAETSKRLCCFLIVVGTTGVMAFAGDLPVASQPETSYTIRHYDLSIRPDFESKIINLRAVLQIRNPQLQSAFNFGLNDQYRKVDVTCPQTPLMVSRGEGEIDVTLQKPVNEFQIVFELQGSLGKSLDENRDVLTNSSLFLLWSDRFYPIDFDHWATVRTSVRLPAGFQAVAPGKLVDVNKDANYMEYVFETTNPAVCFSVIADSRWIRTSREVNGIRMETLLYSGSQKYSDQIFRTSGEVLKFYSETYCPYPFDQFTFVTIEGIYARRAFPGFVGYNPDYLERELLATGYEAHETALLWWDYTTRGNGPGSFQWTEGLGDYAELLYADIHNLPIPKIFQTFRERYLMLKPNDDVLYNELRGNTPQSIIHGKYPWLMHLVRYVVGDDAFNRAMKLVFERYRFRTFSMPEFISTMEEGTGVSLQWWRNEWLERKGIPVVSLQFKTGEAQAGKYRVEGVIIQSGQIYHLPVEIGIETRTGTVKERVTIASASTPFHFETSEKPEDVILDPDGWVLMKKVYSKGPVRTGLSDQHTEKR